MSLGVSSHTTDMTTVSFCTEPSSCIMLYSVHECALYKSMACRRAPHEARSPSAHLALILLAQKTAADACPKGLCPTPDGPHALPGDYLVRCISNTTAALDMGILQERPRGDHGMAQMHRVYFVGNLTRNPEVCCAERYGCSAVRRRRASRLRQGDTWHTDVCCIDVAAFGAESRNGRRLSAQRPRRPHRGALAVAAVEQAGQPTSPVRSSSSASSVCPAPSPTSLRRPRMRAPRRARNS